MTVDFIITYLTPQEFSWVVKLILNLERIQLFFFLRLYQVANFATPQIFTFTLLG